MKDLFGNTPEKLEDRYKGRHGAHPARPGTGPEGRICKDCRYCKKLEYHTRTYYKCEMVVWTHGLGTDLRLKDEACGWFKLK